jgi:hypothetical protein
MNPRQRRAGGPALEEWRNDQRVAFRRARALALFWRLIGLTARPPNRRANDNGKKWRSCISKIASTDA